MSTRDLIKIGPSPFARAVVGQSPKACRLAIECWAQLLRESMPKLTRGQWRILADSFNGFELGDPEEMTAEGLSAWLFGHPPVTGRPIAALVSKLNSLTYLEVQYILAAIRFYWRWTKDINSTSDPWWTIKYRVMFFLKRAAAEPVPGEIVG